LTKVVSGGQTGVDRAALDVAIELGIPHGGWCPRGRLAEDGPIPARYELLETESSAYPLRTERNVADSDATLILFRGPLSGGTKLTLRLAERYGKPRLAVNLDCAQSSAEVRQWLADAAVQVLNVAGPRESQSKGISVRATEYLREILK